MRILPVLPLLIPLVMAANAPDPVPITPSKRAWEVLRELVQQPSLIREALGKLKDRLSVDLPSSMIDQKALEAVEKQTLAENRIIPDPLPALNTPDRIRSLAAKGSTAGTIIGSQSELRELRGAAKDRADEIDDLKAQQEQAKLLGCGLQEGRRPRS